MNLNTYKPTNKNWTSFSVQWCFILVSIFKSNTLQYRNVSYWMQFLSYSNTCILHIDFLKLDKLYFTYKLLLLLYTNHAVHSMYSLYYDWRSFPVFFFNFCFERSIYKQTFIACILTFNFIDFIRIFIGLFIFKQ